MAESSTMLSDNSSIGDAVSSREGVESIEDEGLYYIPERRPSLDLGPSPMDTSQWYVEIYDFLAFPNKLKFHTMQSL